MANNIKITTEDVDQILDGKIKATSAHSQLTVAIGDDYDSVLSKITARLPSLPEKQALDNALLPSAVNPYITLSQLTAELDAKIPWVTIGLVGSGSDYEGSDETAFQNAFTAGGSWFQIREGTYTFTAPLTIPTNVRLVGTSAISTVLTGAFAGSVLTVGANSFTGFLSVTQTLAGETALTLGNNSKIENVVATSPTLGKTLVATSKVDLKIFESVFQGGTALLTSCTESFIHGCLLDSPAVNALSLVTSGNISLTSCIFKQGFFHSLSSTNLRVVGNHFEDGTNLVTSTAILRANTPNTYNNEEDDFVKILSYIGSPSLLTENPSYSNNYGGPPGEDLTARVSSLDLLMQWRYEERNFHLLASAEPTTVTWNPTTNALTTSGTLRLQSSHRDSFWTLPILSAVNIPTGNALYYVIDRTLTTSPITLTPVIAPLGSIPNDRANRQIYVLAFALGTTLWWRGGNGSRFPGTGSQTGVYYVDGTSKSLLDFLGATDYNDFDPNYSDNFSGVQGESLVTRLGKTDTLIRRLFEYSNHGVHLSDAGSITVETGPGATYTVALSGTWYLSYPHVAGRITASTASWDLADGQLVYFTVNQGGLAGSDVAISASTIVANGSLPLPNAYPLTTKYFVFARRVGTSVFLWDNTELPVGGRYPTPIGRKVVPVAVPTILTDNVQWDGTNFLWEGLKLAVSTGQSLDRNVLADRTTSLAGTTNLAEGEGLVVTHTWNAGSTPQNVFVVKLALPLVNQLDQNQFLWVMRRNNTIIFMKP